MKNSKIIHLTFLILVISSFPGFGQASLSLKEIETMVKTEKTGTIFDILTKRGFKIKLYYDVVKETWQYHDDMAENEKTHIEYKTNDLDKMNVANGWEFGWFNKESITQPDIFEHPNTSIEIFWPLQLETHFEKLKTEIEKTSKKKSSSFNEHLMTYITTYVNENSLVSYKLYKSNDHLSLTAYFRSSSKMKEIMRLTELNKKLKDEHVSMITKNSVANGFSFCNCKSFLLLNRTEDLYWYCEHELARRHNLKADMFDEMYGNYGHDYKFQYEIDKNPEVLQKIKDDYKKECNESLEDEFDQEQISEQSTGLVEDAISVPFTRMASLVVLDINICDYSFQYILDSGASDLSINRSIENYLLKCGLITKENYLKPEKYLLADGKTKTFKRVLIPKLKLQDLEIENIISIIVDDNSPLLLGKGVLDRFESWKIDNEKNIIEIKVN